jgi:hypothetical protein
MRRRKAILITDNEEFADQGRRGGRARAGACRAKRSRAQAGAISAHHCGGQARRRGGAGRPHRAGTSRNRDRRSGALARARAPCRRDLPRPHTPEAMGDYIAGPNHVLPTSRTARFSSGLSVFDFLKRTTLLACTPGTIAALGPDAITLAEAEGLDAHARPSPRG